MSSNEDLDQAHQAGLTYQEPDNEENQAKGSGLDDGNLDDPDEGGKSGARYS